MFKELFKRNLLITVVDYSEKLASDEITNTEEAEKCHWAKLTLYKEYEKRVISLRTISDSNHESAIPYILKEINSLTKKRLIPKHAQLVQNLYSILRSKNSSPID